MLKKTKNVFLTFALVSFVALISTTSSPAEAADDDRMFVTTLNVASGHTDCKNNNFGYKLDERAAVVRGSKTKIRISKHLIDVGLESASMSGCGGSSVCDADVKRKGNENGKGFVEVELDLKDSASAGNADLVLKYAGGGRGEYKILVVRDSRVDSVRRVDRVPSGDRFTLSGNNLNQLKSTTSGTRAGSSSFALSRVSEADGSVVFDRTERNCAESTFEVDLTLDGSAFCRVNNVKVTPSRDNLCVGRNLANNGGNGGVVNGGGGPPRGVVASTPNLLPTTIGAPLLRPITIQNGLTRMNPALCGTAGAMPSNTPTTVNVPALTWGVTKTGTDSLTTPFNTQLIDATNPNALVVLQTVQHTAGFAANTPQILTANYTGRPTTVRVVLNPKVGAATVDGCFLEPGTNPRLDPKALLVRVDPTNAVNEGTREDDNDLQF